MIERYMDAAMAKANYVQDCEGYLGCIPGFAGLHAIGATEEECREMLRDALREWLEFSVAQQLEIPVIEGMSFGPGRSRSEGPLSFRRVDRPSNN